MTASYNLKLFDKWKHTGFFQIGGGLSLGGIFFGTNPGDNHVKGYDIYTPIIRTAIKIRYNPRNFFYGISYDPKLKYERTGYAVYTCFMLNCNFS